MRHGPLVPSIVPPRSDALPLGLGGGVAALSLTGVDALPRRTGKRLGTQGNDPLGKHDGDDDGDADHDAARIGTTSAESSPLRNVAHRSIHTRRSSSISSRS